MVLCPVESHHNAKINTSPEDPSYESLKENLQNLKSSLKKKIRCAKAKYYAEVFEKNKSNIRHTWEAIKEILGKFKNKKYWVNLKTNMIFQIILP